jgi:hypothetical protein
MLQDMMIMMQNFTKSEERKGQSKLSEVTMMVDQYESNKPPCGEKEEWHWRLTQ